ncbi:nuclear serine protease 2 [Colletotrichum abscissum]|uniref:Pro-apoptotic serine protease NMA111 n=1 Tax=Colletotrichum abscissum TaxID=1671311 RepID=A0A9P9X271_9PEZI|nr:nuclear serine protease 2 [Colletotrichum abscissum]
MELVIRNVVSIHCCHPVSFDGKPAGSGEATGFVVDAQEGLILTNRHVVGAGPFWGSAVFENHEEVDVYPVYRDPVHDFAFLRFNPRAVKHLALDGLQLRPDLAADELANGAAVGLEVRVVGNDAGEKVSILPAWISRLDRNTPDIYRSSGYRDFNACYLQATASAAEGSSGSPVLNIDGYVVGLLAAGSIDHTSTLYFLPLDRPLRALQRLQRGEPVPRGDLQCQLLLKSLEECKHLGLTDAWEAVVRQECPDENSLLVAEVVLPNGPADQKIKEGDIIMKINGEIVTKFDRFDDILDSSVHDLVYLQLQRGGNVIEVDVEVGDLHTITPDRFISVSGAIFHTLSYQKARAYAVACQGVFISHAAGASSFYDVGSNCIVYSVDHKEVPDLEAFGKVMEGIPDRSQVIVSYKCLTDLHTLQFRDIRIDRHWFPDMELRVRNDQTGQWDFVTLANPLPPTVSVSGSAYFTKLENLESKLPAVASVLQSLVHVEFTTPVLLDGYPYSRGATMGLVIDAGKGLLIASRARAPFDLCDVMVTIAYSITVPGKICFLHPLENYVIIQYNPDLVDASVQSSTLSDERLSPGSSVNFIGYNKLRQFVHTSTTVTAVRQTTLAASDFPSYRTSIFDQIIIETEVDSSYHSGVLVSDDGVIRALWFSYLGGENDYFSLMGVATPTLLPVISQIRGGISPSLRMLPVQFDSISLDKAKPSGLSDEWIGKITRANQTRVFIVLRQTLERSRQTPSLLEGDILLTLNGKLIVETIDLNVMYSHRVLDAVVVRNGQEHRIKATTITTEDVETDHAVVFCGAILQQPYLAVRQQLSQLHSEVYVTFHDLGSPASRFNLRPTYFITHVNGNPTPDLKAFLEIAKKIPDNACEQKGPDIVGVKQLTSII